MNILLLDTSKEMRGGQRQLCYLAPALLARGVSITVAARPGSPLAGRLRELGIPVFFINPSFEGSPAAAYGLGRWMRRHRVALVNAQSSHDHTLAWFATRFLSKTPCRLVTRRVDFSPGGSLFHKKKYLKGADHYIAISAAIAGVLTNYGIPEGRVHIIRSCVEPKARVPNARGLILEELGIPEGASLIGDVAELVDHKGHNYLLQAFSRLLADRPDSHLLLVGDGPLRGELESLSRSLRCRHRVHFLGRRNDVARILSALDLFVMTSHLEGLCTSILEAMSLHIPVVATRAGGIPEIVRDGVTGLLADNKTPESIALMISRTLEDPEGAKRRAKKAHDMVMEEFTVENMAAKTAALYHELCGLY